MNSKILILYVVIFAGPASFAQTGNKVTNVTLTNVNDIPVKLPLVGQKTFVLFYIDPDVRELSNPLTEAIYSKNYSKDKFGAIGVVNCKDTWIPNSVIRNGVVDKQKQYPESVLLLDKNYILKSAWKTCDGNNAMVVYVIGKDALVKFYTVVKDERNIKAIIEEVLQCIDENL